MSSKNMTRRPSEGSDFIPTLSEEGKRFLEDEFCIFSESFQELEDKIHIKEIDKNQN